MTLRQEMQAAGLTNRKVAEEHDCTVSVVSAVANGTYASMNSKLAQEILTWIDGWLHPENYGFID